MLDCSHFHPTAVERFGPICMAVEHHVKPLGGRSTVLFVPIHPKLFDGGPEAKNARVYPALLENLGEEAAALIWGDGHPLHSGHERGETNVPGIPGEGGFASVHHALLYHSHLGIAEEMFSPGGERVGLQNQSSSVQEIALLLHLKRVNRKDMAGVRVGITPPVSACS